MITYDPLCTQTSLIAFGYKSIDNLESALSGADCLLIAVGHEAFRKVDYQRIVTSMRTRIIFDCCGLIQPSDAKTWNVSFRALGNGDHSIAAEK